MTHGFFRRPDPHTYTPVPGPHRLNVGWLDEAHPFTVGQTSLEFQEALRRLCAHPIHLYCGFHQCQFCPTQTYKAGSGWPEQWGNGQIEVQGADGTWYAAPKLIYHYVTAHGYCPPAAFIEAVLHPRAVAAEET